MGHINIYIYIYIYIYTHTHTHYNTHTHTTQHTHTYTQHTHHTHTHTHPHTTHTKSTVSKITFSLQCSRYPKSSALSKGIRTRPSNDSSTTAVCSTDGMVLTGENPTARRRTSPSITFSTTILTRPGPGSNPDLLGTHHIN